MTQKTKVRVKEKCTLASKTFNVYNYDPEALKTLTHACGEL